MKPFNLRFHIRALSALLGACACFALFGCSHLSGKYESTGPGAGVASLEFRNGSKAYMTVLGNTVETEYTVDGDKITLKNVNGENMVLTEQKDGTLSGPMGMTLKKKE